MIRFVLDRPTRFLLPETVRVREQSSNESDPEFIQGEKLRARMLQSPYPEPQDEPDENSTYIRTHSTNGASKFDDVNYESVSGRVKECLYYEDEDYAICGYSDTDPEVTITGPYASREEARRALLEDFNYGELIGPFQDLGWGEFSKAYQGNFLYRWQAAIIGSENQFRIWTDGPEPDPVFSWLIVGGTAAVEDWHDEY